MNALFSYKNECDKLTHNLKMLRPDLNQKDITDEINNCKIAISAATRGAIDLKKALNELSAALSDSLKQDNDNYEMFFDDLNVDDISFKKDNRPYYRRFEKNDHNKTCKTYHC